MPLITVPAGLRLAERGQWRLRTVTTTSGLALDGRQQWIRRENRVWQNDYDVFRARIWENHGAYLAFLDDLAGVANTFVVPVGNRRLPGDGYFHVEDDEFHTDDEDEFHVAEDVDPTLTAEAPAAATILSVSESGARLIPGTYFSANDFLYRVASNDDEGTVRINPPLREAIAEDATLNVLAPQIRVRLIDDDAAARAHEAPVWGGSYTLSVIEAFER